MTNPTAAMLVIGDEILSGRTRDTNSAHLAAALTRQGIDLREIRVVADDHRAIVAAVRALLPHDHVFTCGGIGPTHDDITADAVAEAMEVPLAVRGDARALLAAHYAKSGTELNAARLRMARIPEGARLIDNPISAAPGFSIGRVHVMAGVPAIFEAMVASLLPTLTGGEPLLSQSWRILKGEGEVAEALRAIAAEFPQVAIGSYPFQQNGIYGTNIVMRSPAAGPLSQAMTRLARLFPDGQG